MKYTISILNNIIKIIIFILIMILITSCSYEESMVKKSFLIDATIVKYHGSNVHFIDSKTLILGSKYIIKLKKDNISTYEIKWKKNLFDEYRSMKLLSNVGLLGLDENGTLALGRLNNLNVKLLLPNYNMSGNGFDTDQKGLLYYIEEIKANTTQVYIYDVNNLKITKKVVLKAKYDKILVNKENIIFFRDKVADIYAKQNFKKIGEVQSIENFNGLDNTKCFYIQTTKDNKNTVYFYHSFSRKGIMFSNKNYHNFILKLNSEKNVLDYIVENRSQFFFQAFDVYDDKVVLIYRYKDKAYLYTNSLNEFIKDFNN